MNYLSHHARARRIYPDADADFFAGNVLPDLLAASGFGRLRSADGFTGSLADGVRFHHQTDSTFHALPAFALAQAQVNERLLSAAWETVPRRRFFIAHVFVELALDAHVLRESPDMADHLYYALTESLAGTLVARTEAILNRPAPNLRESIERFVASGFLRDYATPEGLANALTRVCRRAGVPNFETPADRQTLSGLFADFAPRLAPMVPELLLQNANAVVQLPR